MANNPSNHDGFIIIGVDEENGYRIYSLDTDKKRKKTADIVNVLRDASFAGGVRPIVQVQKVKLDSADVVDVIIIKNDRNVPYFLSERYRNVRAHHIYTRTADTNTPVDSSTDINVQEKLWRKRFGIDATGLERIKTYLQRPEDWIQTSNDVMYYKYAPEFTVAEERIGGYHYPKIWDLLQADNRVDCSTLYLCVHQTVLEEIFKINLDGARCSVIHPKREVLEIPEDMYKKELFGYYYFVRDSLEYILYRFLETKNMDDDLFVRNLFLDCILLFKDDEEKSLFDDFLRSAPVLEKLSKFKCKIPYMDNVKGMNMERQREEYRRIQFCKRLLEQIRTKSR